jgi:hypothetical protein
MNARWIIRFIIVGRKHPFTKSYDENMEETITFRIYSGRVPEFATTDHRRAFARRGDGELKASAPRETSVLYLNELRPAARSVHRRGEAIALDPHW